MNRKIQKIDTKFSQKQDSDSSHIVGASVMLIAVQKISWKSLEDMKQIWSSSISTPNSTHQHSHLPQNLPVFQML